MKSFWKFMMMMERTNSAKSGLYPLGYDGIGNVPPAGWVTKSADAIYYLSKDDRLFKTHEGSPFKITHIAGEIIPPKDHGMPGEEMAPRETNVEPEPVYNLPPGDMKTPTSWVKLVTHPKLLDPKKFK